MKYSRVVQYVATQPWALYGPKLAQLLSVLAFKAGGGEFTAEEIKAQIGDPEQPEPSKRGAVAVLPLRGVIAHRMGTMEESSGGMSTERFGKMFRAAVEDPGISAIVLDVDSPGGTVEGVPELAAEMLALKGRKKVVAVANACMCSAAYWIASAADEIVATPSALVGSIGVYTAHQDLSQMLEQEGVKVTLISAGKHKVDGNPLEPLDDETQAKIQEQVDEAYAMFVKDVAKGRGVTPAAVRGGYGEGRAVTAQEAKGVGLVDRIGTLDETIGRLIGRRSGAGMRAEGDLGDLEAQASQLHPDEAALVAAIAADEELRQRIERF